MAKHDLKLHTFETAPEAWRKQRGALTRGLNAVTGPGGILGSRGI